LNVIEELLGDFILFFGARLSDITREEYSVRLDMHLVQTLRQIIEEPAQIRSRVAARVSVIRGYV